MGGALFCLTRPEALRMEAKLLHAAADFLDPPSDEDRADSGECLGHRAPDPLPPALVLAQGAQHPRLAVTGPVKDRDQSYVPPRVPPP